MSIVDGNIAFPNYKQLNDPFESSIESAIDQLRIDFKYGHFSDHQIIPILPGPGDIVSDHFQYYNEDRDNHSHNLAVKDHNIRLEKALKYLVSCQDRLGILSLTSDPKNVVMWAHYAENSAGVCIGIEIDHSFFKNYEPLRWGQGAHTLFQPQIVIYQQQRPTYSGATPVRYAEKAFFTKYEPWSYEKEYRILRPISECDATGTVPLYSIPNILIKEIIIGMNASKELRKIVLELSKKFKHLKPMMIKKVSENYKLQLRSLC